MTENEKAMAINNIPKKRAVISYENMSDELMDAFREKYPHGYADYMADIVKIDKPDGTFFHVVEVEIPDALYLVKIKVKVDDYAEAEKDLFDTGDDEADGGEGGEDGGFPASDDDIAPRSIKETMKSFIFFRSHQRHKVSDSSGEK